MRTILAVALLMAQTCVGNATQWEEETHIFGSWNLWFGTSELDDSPAVAAMLEDESSGHVLAVGCEERVPYVNYYFVDEGERVSGDIIEVNLRFDKNNPEQMEWVPAASGVAALIEGDVALPFIMAANAADELYIRAFDNNIGDLDARFPMIGIREVAFQVQKACPENN